MNRRLKNTLITLAFPVAMFLIMEAVCLLVVGKHVIDFSTNLDLVNLVRNTGIACAITYALSFNLTSGRLDLSLGAQRLAGTVIGSNIALSLGLTGVWLLLFALVFGLLFGLLVGAVFVWVRVPPMVLGIGMGLILESVVYVTSRGIGLNLFGVQGITILSEAWFTVLVVAVLLVLVLYLVAYTKFGYQMRAIQGSQRIAQNSGINIFRHAVLCYTFAGGLVGVSGILDASYKTQMAVTSGNGSSGTVVSNTFPMFLGVFLGRWSNQAVGILVATPTLKIFAVGLAKLQLSEALSNVVNMFLYLSFLVYLANEHYFKKKKAVAERLDQVREKKRELGIPVRA